MPVPQKLCVCCRARGPAPLGLIKSCFIIRPLPVFFKPYFDGKQSLKTKLARLCKQWYNIHESTAFQYRDNRKEMDEPAGPLGLSAGKGWNV